MVHELVLDYTPGQCINSIPLNTDHISKTSY